MKSQKYLVFLIFNLQLLKILISSKTSLSSKEKDLNKTTQNLRIKSKPKENDKKKKEKERSLEEIKSECDSECSKLSKIYSCYCDVTCLEYGDCCKFYIKDCKNYFRNLLKETNLIKEINQNKTKAENKTNDEEIHFVTVVNFDGKNEANKNSTKFEFEEKEKENSVVDKLNKTELVDFNGRCCSNKVKAFNCFCDDQCKSNGDCCSDFDYCYKNNLLSKYLDLRKELIKVDFNYNREIKRKVRNREFGNENNQTFKKVNFNFTKDDNGNGKFGNKSHIGFADVKTLTPQIGMKYYGSNSFKRGNELNKDQIKIKMSPAEIKFNIILNKD